MTVRTYSVVGRLVAIYGSHTKTKWVQIPVIDFFFELDLFVCCYSFIFTNTFSTIFNLMMTEALQNPIPIEIWMKTQTQISTKNRMRHIGLVLEKSILSLAKC